jgi:hypothetical protein
MTAVDSVVDDYLRRLEQAATGLPADRRQELLDGISEHIAAARAAGIAANEAAVRTLLDRLGEPEEIVPAAQELDAHDGTPGSPQELAAGGAGSTATRPGTGLELAAVLLLTAGSFVPVIGWLAGVVLLWSSRLWRLREKVVGTLVVPLGPGGLLLYGALLLLQFGQTETCNATPAPAAGVPAPFPGAPRPGDVGSGCTIEGPPEWLGTAVLVTLLLAPVVVAVLLLRTARRRATTT